MNGRILKEAAVLSAAAVLLTGCQTVDSTHEPGFPAALVSASL